MKKSLIALIKFYQFFSRRGKPHCRFYPSCSQYAIDALNKYSIWKALGKSLIRVSKCHPWHPGGVDQA